MKDAHKIKVTECSVATVLYKEELTDIAEIKTMCSLLTKIKYQYLELCELYLNTLS